MIVAISVKKLHKIERIDQVVREYFEENSHMNEILAKNLMRRFIDKGIFLRDYDNGLPIRQLLRLLNKENKLHLLKQCRVMRMGVNRSWYFMRIPQTS